jgi:hypothetical protein
MNPVKKLMLGAPVAAALLLAAPAAKAQQACYDEIFEDYGPSAGSCFCAGPYTNGGGSITDCFTAIGTDDEGFPFQYCNSSGNCCGDCSWV